MRTFLVARGTVVPQQQQTTAQVVQATQYAVVSARFALALQGSKRFSTGNGKLYAVFSTEVQAAAYVAEHKLRMVAKVIPW